MRRFEYKIVPLPMPMLPGKLCREREMPERSDFLDEVQGELDELGAQGWRLVTLIPKVGASDSYCDFIFMRELPEEPGEQA